MRVKSELGFMGFGVLVLGLMRWWTAWRFGWSALRRPGHTPLAALAPLSSHERGEVHADVRVAVVFWLSEPGIFGIAGWLLGARRIATVLGVSAFGAYTEHHDDGECASGCLQHPQPEHLRGGQS